MRLLRGSRYFLLAVIAVQWVSGGWLGILVQDLTPKTGARYGLFAEEGVLVTRVQFNSPAAAGGVKEGDLIVSLDGKAIANSDALVEVVKSLSHRQSIQLGIMRNGSKRTLHIVLGAKPRAET